MSEWLLFNAKWAIFLLYHGENKLYSMTWCPLCTRPTRLVGFPQIDMSLHWDALSWFWANQSLLIVFNAVCLAEKQQIQILVLGVGPSTRVRTHNLPHSKWVHYYTTGAVMCDTDIKHVRRIWHIKTYEICWLHNSVLMHFCL